MIFKLPKCTFNRGIIVPSSRTSLLSDATFATTYSASQHSFKMAGWLWHEELQMLSFNAGKIPNHDNIESNAQGSALGRQWL